MELVKNQEDQEKIAKKSKKRNFKLHPVTVFIILSALVIIVSGIADLLNFQANYDKVNTATGGIDNYLVTVHSLFNVQGIRYIISNAIINFISFAPLGTIIIALLGLGVAENSGMLKTIFTKTTNKMPDYLVTFIIIFLGIMSNLVVEIGYVFLLPLGGLIFLHKKRNPMAGIIAAFSGVAGGIGLNLIVGPIDHILASYTNSAAEIIDASYQASITGNLFFMIFMTVAISLTGMLVTEKFIIPKLGKYEIEEEEPFEIGKKEKKGLRLSLLVTIIMIIGLIYLVLPGLSFLPGSGMLLDPYEDTYINQLFGYNSYFQEGITVIVSITFLLAGLFYGIGSKTIKNDKDLIKGMTLSLNNIGLYLVIIFFASQFVALFKETNLGTVLIASIANLVKNVGFTGIPLILLLIVVSSIVNIFVPSSTTKWAILAPVFVPLFMQLNITPEFTQLIFRSGDSITNILTPCLAYFAIFIALLNRYNKNDNKPITIGKTISLMYPYSLIYTLVWVAALITWYFIGLPIGPGINPSL